ncbi:hypothetical protein, partial [Flavobacterium sp. HTF]|uniref:hypothetical protein n=1 Tax=Flavobacterium sp. HTF TaxID=2170732 RepID=UPI000D5FDF38
MKVEFKLITESIFNELKSEIIFNAETPRCYGMIGNENYSFKFGWQSEIIIPKVNQILESTYSVGIDLNFAIIDFEKGTIVFNLLLDYFFYEMKLHEDFLYVITELSIIKIELITFRIIETFSLPDFFEEIIFDKNRIEVKCSNNEVAYF